MKNKQKAKFFCENCGSEVPENAKMCKVCGKFFISVRCPKCGATGSHNDFSKGCPKCGYAVGGSHQYRKNKFTNGRSFFDFKSIFGGKSNINHSRGNQSDSSLPLWVYVVTFVVFIVVIFAIYSCITNPVY